MSIEVLNCTRLMSRRSAAYSKGDSQEADLQSSRVQNGTEQTIRLSARQLSIKLI